MPDTPDIASIAAMIGDPARSRILLALMGGRALTATELSLEAEVSPSTASAHLAKLTAARLIQVQRQGRHRYFQIADELVADLVERLCRLALRDGAPRVRTGPTDPALRKARVCYDHLAGDVGVRLFESLIAQKWLVLAGDGIALSPAGERALGDFGIDLPAVLGARRVVCRPCLDWSVRRHHLAGALGAAILSRIYARRWARKDLTSRALHFTPSGEQELARVFRLRPEARDVARPLIRARRGCPHPRTRGGARR